VLEITRGLPADSQKQEDNPLGVTLDPCYGYQSQGPVVSSSRELWACSPNWRSRSAICRGASDRSSARSEREVETGNTMGPIELGP
jgi:hypothetical protein